jgi:hypothetical protein
MKSFIAADFSQKLYVNGKVMKDVDVSLEGDEKGINIDTYMDGKHKKKYIKSSQIKNILGANASSESLENRLNQLLSNKNNNKSKKKKNKSKKKKNKSKTRKTRK